MSLHQNYRGLNTKCNDFYTGTLNLDFDTMIAVETWLQEGVQDAELVKVRTSIYNLLLS